MPRNPMVLVKLLTSRAAVDRSDPAGATIPLPADEAKRYVDSLQAEYAGDAPGEPFPDAEPGVAYDVTRPHLEADAEAKPEAEAPSPEAAAKPAPKSKSKRGANGAKTATKT